MSGVIQCHSGPADGRRRSRRFRDFAQAKRIKKNCWPLTQSKRSVRRLLRTHSHTAFTSVLAPLFVHAPSPHLRCGSFPLESRLCE